MERHGRLELLRGLGRRPAVPHNGAESTTQWHSHARASICVASRGRLRKHQTAFSLGPTYCRQRASAASRDPAHSRPCRDRGRQSKCVLLLDRQRQCLGLPSLHRRRTNAHSPLHQPHGHTTNAAFRPVRRPVPCSRAPLRLAPGNSHASARGIMDAVAPPVCAELKRHPNPGGHRDDACHRGDGAARFDGRRSLVRSPHCDCAGGCREGFRYAPTTPASVSCAR